MTWWLWLGLLAGLLAVAAAGLNAFGAKRWTDRMADLIRGLDAARNGGTANQPYPTHYDAHELEGLPVPVQRYFRAVLQDGQRIVSAVAIDMFGTIDLSPTAQQWKPFTSKQRVVTRQPGFVWDARVAMRPGVPVRVVDSYVAGKGLLHAAMLGLGEIARGELMRFFAEAPLYPTALLPSQGVQWAAVDERSANATLVDGALTLTLLFRFNDDGLIDSVRAEARVATVGKEIVMMPWECGFSDYEVRSGMTVPNSGEAAYWRPAGRKTYFIGTVTSLSYEFAT